MYRSRRSRGSSGIVPVKGGFRLTPQRLAILACLDRSREHPSAEDVYRAVRRKFPNMSFATVYNTLETLKRHGMVSELILGAGRKRFEPDTKPHHHLTCIICKSIEDIYTLSGPAISGSARKGFRIMGSHVWFFGVCPSCRKRKGAKEGSHVHGA